MRNTVVGHYIDTRSYDKYGYRTKLEEFIRKTDYTVVQQRLEEGDVEITITDVATFRTLEEAVELVSMANSVVHPRVSEKV